MYKILLVLILSFSVYTGFVYQHTGAGATPAADRARVDAGWRHWQELNCQSCHQLYGLGGYMGPDLTNAARKGPDYLRAFLLHGTRRMPDFQLSDSAVGQLIAFLNWVDQSGSSRVPDSAVHWTGTYLLE